MTANRDKEMREEIRQFYRRNPHGFRECIEEFEAWVRERREGDRRPRIPRIALVMLLADWHQAKRRRIRRDDFLARRAAKGLKWGDGRELRGTWVNENTILDHLKEAQRRCKEDASFAADVEFYTWALGKVGGE